MKNYNYFSYSAWGGMTRLLAIMLLVCSSSANATAPRITAELFGEEKKVDIVAYQSASSDAAANSENALTVEIATAAFKAAGKTPTVDVLPSKQLATYALFNNDAAGLIGSHQDLAAKDKNQYRVVTFYMKLAGDEPVALIFSNVRGKELHKAFVEGMQKILKNGKYLQIVEKHRGKLPADYVSRLKRLNPGWK
ncbi:MAG: hypothetical protein Q7T38_04625 [Gallionella sp.]|nr:hypothetical protein [Gallionella sp.]